MEEWLLKACKASRRSSPPPLHSVTSRTRCPNPRRNFAQRADVCRLPLRGAADRGTTRAIFILAPSIRPPQYSAEAEPQREQPGRNAERDIREGDQQVASPDQVHGFQAERREGGKAAQQPGKQQDARIG